MKYKEIRKLFKKAGWTLIRNKGSHQTWGKGQEIETIAGKDTDEVPKGLENHFRKRLGLK